LPTLGSKENLIFQGSGKKTIDIQQIIERFEILGIIIEDKALKGTLDIRNDIEHYGTPEIPSRLKGLMADSFIILRNFITT